MGLRKIRAAGGRDCQLQDRAARAAPVRPTARPKFFATSPCLRARTRKTRVFGVRFFPEFVVYTPAWHRQAHEPYDGSVILFFLRFVPRKYTFFRIPPHWVFVRPRRQIWRFDATWHLTLAHFRCEPREGNLVSGYVPLPLFSLRVTNASKRHSRPHPHLPHTHTPNHQQNNGRYLRYERHRPRRCQARQGHRR